LPEEVTAEAKRGVCSMKDAGPLRRSGIDVRLIRLWQRQLESPHPTARTSLTGKARSSSTINCSIGVVETVTASRGGCGRVAAVARGRSMAGFGRPLKIEDAAAADRRRPPAVVKATAMAGAGRTGG